jgi:two-component system, NtrC family, nitrogen regulation sensor histidine kinase NtrY
MRFSLEGKLALFCGSLAVGATLIVALLADYLGEVRIAIAVALAILIPTAVLLSRRYARSMRHTLSAITDGITSLKDSDFSISIAQQHDDELGQLIRAYNGLGSTLRDQRQDLLQRELLLETVIQTTPLALLLTDDAGHVLYSNLAARELFSGGRKPEGLKLAALLATAPASMRDAFVANRDTLFTVQIGSEPEIFHLTCRGFRLNARPHQLYLLKQLTRELSAQEVATWKKVIRVIAHELNNSLAPISSLAHSGRLLAHAPDEAQLDRVFGTIEERAAHLKNFIEGYARFAKMPRPRLTEVEWPAFVELLGAMVPFRVRGTVPAERAHFDPAQFQQVLINLLKNAQESGSPRDEIEVAIESAGSGWQLRVLDRGSGMTETELRNALLPFYSTKPTGTGLGLTLCREVLEAHGGRITLANRAEGGLAVTLWIPRTPLAA